MPGQKPEYRISKDTAHFQHYFVPWNQGDIFLINNEKQYYNKPRHFFILLHVQNFYMCALNRYKIKKTLHVIILPYVRTIGKVNQGREMNGKSSTPLLKGIGKVFSTHLLFCLLK